MTLQAIVSDTFREAFARKTIIGFFAISTFFLLGALLVALFLDEAAFVNLGRTPADVQQQVPLEEIVRVVQTLLTGLLHFGALLLSIFATAGIIPNTLEKGAIDLLLSKPVSRATILAGKYLGGSLMVLANVAYYVLGMWIIMGVKTGVWNPSFLAAIPLVTLSFMLMFAVMLPIGVASRSSALTIIVLYAHLYFLSPLLQGRELILFSFIDDTVVRGIFDGLYYILPKPNGMSSAIEAVVAHQQVEWMPFWSTALFSLAMAALALFLLRRKDF